MIIQLNDFPNWKQHPDQETNIISPRSPLIFLFSHYKWLKLSIQSLHSKPLSTSPHIMNTTVPSQADQWPKALAKNPGSHVLFPSDKSLCSHIGWTFSLGLLVSYQLALSLGHSSLPSPGRTDVQSLSQLGFGCMKAASLWWHPSGFPTDPKLCRAMLQAMLVTRLPHPSPGLRTSAHWSGRRRE